LFKRPWSIAVSFPLSFISFFLPPLPLLPYDKGSDGICIKTRNLFHETFAEYRPVRAPPLCFCFSLAPSFPLFVPSHVFSFPFFSLSPPNMRFCFRISLKCHSSLGRRIAHNEDPPLPLFFRVSFARGGLHVCFDLLGNSTVAHICPFSLRRHAIFLPPPFPLMKLSQSCLFLDESKTKTSLY